MPQPYGTLTAQEFGDRLLVGNEGVNGEGKGWGNAHILRNRMPRAASRMTSAAIVY